MRYDVLDIKRPLTEYEQRQLDEIKGEERSRLNGQRCHSCDRLDTEYMCVCTGCGLDAGWCVACQSNDRGNGHHTRGQTPRRR